MNRRLKIALSGAFGGLIGACLIVTIDHGFRSILSGLTEHWMIFAGAVIGGFIGGWLVPPTAKIKPKADRETT